MVRRARGRWMIAASVILAGLLWLTMSQVVAATGPSQTDGDVVPLAGNDTCVNGTQTSGAV